MKILISVCTLTILHASLAIGEKAIELNSQQDKASYALGQKMGAGIKSQPFTLSDQAFLKGIKDSFTGADPLLTLAQQEEAMKTIEEEVRKNQAKIVQDRMEKNSKAGDAFLKENKSKDGIVTTSSGLQYEVLVAGEGAQPLSTDTVTVHYTGKLIDGNVFDSSLERGQPATFPVNRVIPGWTEALQLMKTGSKWNLFIPSDLAYGENGAPPKIEPNATLLFEVELISIKPKDSTDGS